MNDEEYIELNSEYTESNAEELSEFYERQARRYGKNLDNREEGA